MKKDYAVIKRFHQTYEVEIAVLAVAAIYMSMLLATFFCFFQFVSVFLRQESHYVLVTVDQGSACLASGGKGVWCCSLSCFFLL